MWDFDYNSRFSPSQFLFHCDRFHIKVFFGMFFGLHQKKRCTNDSKRRSDQQSERGGQSGLGVLGGEPHAQEAHRVVRGSGGDGRARCCRKRHAYINIDDKFKHSFHI